MRKWERLARTTLGEGYGALVAGGRAVRRAARRHRLAAAAAMCLFVGFAAGVLWPLRDPWPPPAAPPANRTATAPPVEAKPAPVPRHPASSRTSPATTPATRRTAAPATPAASPPAMPTAERLHGPADFRPPLAGEVVAAFGWRRDLVFGDYRFHPGVDLQGRPGQGVAAAAAGRVSAVRSAGSDYGSEPAGWDVTVTHSDGWLTRYRFAGRVRVGAGEPVGRGETLGTLASPGLLHFALYRGEQAQQPALSPSPEG